MLTIPKHIKNNQQQQQNNLTKSTQAHDLEFFTILLGK